MTYIGQTNGKINERVRELRLTVEWGIRTSERAQHTIATQHSINFDGTGPQFTKKHTRFTREASRPENKRDDGPQLHTPWKPALSQRTPVTQHINNSEHQLSATTGRTQRTRTNQSEATERRCRPTGTRRTPAQATWCSSQETASDSVNSLKTISVMLSKRYNRPF